MRRTMRNSLGRMLATLAGAAGLGAMALAPAAAQQPAPAGQPYTATAIHALPGQPESVGRIVKSGTNLRMEYSQGGQQVIQILRPAEGVMYILDPATRSYVELRGPAVPTPNDGYTTPCPDEGQGRGQPIICERIGTDVVSGIDVERWKIAADANSAPLVILWDSTRRRALRQDFPDGSVMAMSFRAMEEIAGRRAEHWVITVTAPGQEPRYGDWWFDPELRVVLREDLPTGESRRLENITVGQIPPDAFEVPAGWTRREMPAAGMQGPRGPSGN